MKEKEFELYAKNKFMEIIEEFEKLHPEYEMFELTLYRATQNIHISCREGNVSRETTFNLKEEK